MVLCRDARDGFDKLAVDARKLAVEGARKQWENRTSLAVARIQQNLLDGALATTANLIVKIEEDKDDLKSSDSTSVKNTSMCTPVIKTEKNYNSDDDIIKLNSCLDVQVEEDSSSTKNMPLSLSTSVTASLSPSLKTIRSVVEFVPKLLVSPPLSLRFEDMPISASRIVNPFSR